MNSDLGLANDLANDLTSGFAHRTVPAVPRPLQQLVGASHDDPRVQALEHGIDPGFATQQSGGWTGVDIALTNRLPLAPGVDLVERWVNDIHGESVIDSAERIALNVINARATQSAALEYAGPDCAGHSEAKDFSDPENVGVMFFYLDDLLHRRRVNMLADVVARLATQRVAENGSAVVLEVGPGPGALARAAIKRLDPMTRSNVSFVAVDVSADLLVYSVANGWADRAIVADISSFNADEMEVAFGHPDVVVASEILEHIPGSAAVVNRGLLEWVRRSGAWFVGSVPNAVQGSELPGLFNGESAPHQLTRHLFDETTEHVSFFTYATLRHAFVEFWEADRAYIWGNGLRLDPQGSAVCLDAGLWFPHRSDRLCFAAAFSEESGAADRPAR